MRNYHQFRYRRRSERDRERLLREWYGNHQHAALEIEIQQKREQKIDAILENVLQPYQTESKRLLRKIITAWADIVGAEVQRHSTPRRLDRHVLYVEISNAPWFYQLNNYAKPEILKKLQVFNNRYIRDLRFIPGGVNSDQP